MSILEIILYSVLGLSFVIWLILTIKNYKKKDNKKDEEDEN